MKICKVYKSKILPSYKSKKREERRENREEERREDGYWAKHKLQGVGVGLQTAVSGSRGICYMLGVQQQNPRTRHYYSGGMLGVKVARGCNNIFNSVSLFNCLSLSVCFSFYFYFSSACRDRRQTLRLFAGNWQRWSGSVACNDRNKLRDARLYCRAQRSQCFLSL